MLPNSSFQQQLNDLQRSYNQLGKPLTSTHEILKISGSDAAKTWAKENLAPSESSALFDENEDVFYVVSKSPEGMVQPLILGRFTLEPEPPKPEYATKQDLAEIKSMIQSLIDKEAKA